MFQTIVRELWKLVMLDSLKNDEVSGSVKRQYVDIQEIKVDFPMPINIPISTPTPYGVLVVVGSPNNAAQHNDETHHKKANL